MSVQTVSCTITRAIVRYSRTVPCATHDAVVQSFVRSHGMVAQSVVQCDHAQKNQQSHAADSPLLFADPNRPRTSLFMFAFGLCEQTPFQVQYKFDSSASTHLCSGVDGFKPLRAHVAVSAVETA